MFKNLECAAKSAVIGVALLFLPASAIAQVADKRCEVRPGCVVLFKSEQTCTPDLQWHGQCVKGYADGKGILSSGSDTKPRRATFMILKAGVQEEIIWVERYGNYAGEVAQVTSRFTENNGQFFMATIPCNSEGRDPRGGDARFVQRSDEVVWSSSTGATSS